MGKLLYKAAYKCKSSELPKYIISLPSVSHSCTQLVSPSPTANTLLRTVSPPTEATLFKRYEFLDFCPFTCSGHTLAMGSSSLLDINLKCQTTFYFIDHMVLQPPLHNKMYIYIMPFTIPRSLYGGKKLTASLTLTPFFFFFY